MEEIKAEVKDTTIEVTWKLPVCSKNIKEIKVDYRKKGETNWISKTANPTDTKMTISGLDKDTEYEVQVVAVDINGISHTQQAPKMPKTSLLILIYVALSSAFSYFEF